MYLKALVFEEEGEEDGATAEGAEPPESVLLESIIKEGRGGVRDRKRVFLNNKIN